MTGTVQLLVVALLVLLAANVILLRRVHRYEKIFDRIGTVAARGLHRV